jgi:hypothetical protein
LSNAAVPCSRLINCSSLSNPRLAESVWKCWRWKEKLCQVILPRRQNKQSPFSSLSFSLAPFFSR